jgi:hypothetical protein
MHVLATAVHEMSTGREATTAAIRLARQETAVKTAGWRAFEASAAIGLRVCEQRHIDCSMDPSAIQQFVAERDSQYE